jgi:hypothetical protein
MISPGQKIPSVTIKQATAEGGADVDPAALFAGKRLAAGGGGFFRVIPYAFTRWAIRQVNQSEGRPAIFYFHPWEIDPGQPRVAGAALKSRLRHYTNLDKMAPKLRQLVSEFAWGRMDLLAHREAVRLDAEAAA